MMADAMQAPLRRFGKRDHGGACALRLSGRNVDEVSLAHLIWLYKNLTKFMIDVLLCDF